MFIEVPKRKKRVWLKKIFQEIRAENLPVFKKKLSEVRTDRIKELSESKQNKGEKIYIDTP